MVSQPRPEDPGPDRESVWDYPRPPAVKAADEHVVVRFAGRVVAETNRPLRVLETSHAPGYYIPREDIAPGVLRPSRGGATVCEFKGVATYFDVVVDGDVAVRAAWTYEHPNPGYGELAGAVSFYPQKVESCEVDGEKVRPVGGSFYGDWITSRVAGPFKGGPGTMGW